ncbi:MAG: hypothetical protein JSV31_05400 [Desulfobacterales bacterium]|nr:MAG: hypothetical protein JSV31_05400 [Desulfobacterales bacterium]
MLLSKFANEVLSKGPSALLPQNLSSEWLAKIQKMADDFLDINFEADSCDDVGDIVDPILSACVSEILSYQQDGTTETSPNDLIKRITIYSIHITIETIRRESGIGVDPPSLDNVFEQNRLSELKDLFPEMEQFFDRVCLAEE